MAPELDNDFEDNLSKVDTWAAAICLVNMLTGGKFSSLENFESNSLKKLLG